MVTKAGLGLIGLGALGVGGVALAKPGWLGMEDRMPKYTTISEINNYSSTYSENTVGNKNAKYLVSNEEKNKDWWDWAYRRLNRSTVSEGKFTNTGQKKVTIGYNGTTGTALNKVCDAAYKENESELKNDGDTNHNKFKKSEVWKYCSIGGTKPQTIEEFNSGNNSNKETYSVQDAIGTTDKKSKLLSINSKNNQWIWDLKDKEFGSATVNEGFFKTEKGKQGDEKKTIKDICKEAYGKPEESTTGPNKLTKEETVKYCSLEGK